MIDSLFNPRLPADRWRAFLLGCGLVLSGVLGRWFVATSGEIASVCVGMVVIGLTLLVRCGRPGLPAYAHAMAVRDGIDDAVPGHRTEPAPPAFLKSLGEGMVFAMGLLAILAIGFVGFVVYALMHIKGEAF